MTKYRGRIAPSPTGCLHLGHAMTFWCAQERAGEAGGELILRLEDLDGARCRKEFRDAIVEDLDWFGLEWDEGPYFQSERRELYGEACEKLHAGGFIYPCQCSRKDVAGSSLAPHDENEEPVYPGTCRPENIVAAAVSGGSSEENCDSAARDNGSPTRTGSYNWRFRVPDGEEMRFVDGRFGEQRAIVGEDFGDFVVWRRDDVPAYQLAVAVDDAAMQITEVVRGEDLLISTFRQLLIYRALGLEPPQFFHTPLFCDENGERLAKRHAAMSLRTLRESGITPKEIRERYRLL